MITAKFTLCALPASSWSTQSSQAGSIINIASFVKDGLATEERLARGVNLENERLRYSLLCTQLEAAIRKAPLRNAIDKSSFEATFRENMVPCQVVGATYLAAINSILKSAPSQAFSMRLGATYFPPDLVEPHIEAFAAVIVSAGFDEHEAVQTRIRFFRLAAEFGCGVVELQDPFFLDTSESIQEAKAPISIEEPLQLETIDTLEAIEEIEGENAYDILRTQLNISIDSARSGVPCAVNFSNQPHNVITEVLNEFVHASSGTLEAPVYISVIYADGSQARPFPLLCLAQPQASVLEQMAFAPILTVALMSMRHLSLDHNVDMAWLRNREVSKGRTFSETDEFCYVQSQRQLRESRSLGSMRLHMYQTGFQPAVIGFYRALVEELILRAGNVPLLQVTPHYYRGNAGFRTGKVWH